MDWATHDNGNREATIGEWSVYEWSEPLWSPEIRYRGSPVTDVDDAGVVDLRLPPVDDKYLPFWTPGTRARCIRDSPPRTGRRSEHP